MSKLATIQEHEVATLDDIESALLELPQLDCPVVHRFADGLYIREVSMPAGAVVMGHHHKGKQLNTLLKGRVLIIVDGVKQEMVAPLTFIGGEGRKVAHILEDTIWQNVFATDETDIEKLEDMFVNKSDAYKHALEQSEIRVVT